MSQRIKDLTIQQIANGYLTDNEFTKKGTEPATLEELHHALNRLSNAYKPLDNELKQTKHDRDQLKKQRWKHYKTIGIERVIVFATFALVVAGFLNTICV